MKLVLASKSPRRRQLFKLLGLDFEIRACDLDERLVEPAEPGRFVEQLALFKARAIKRPDDDCCVVGADTIVVLDGRIIGKPNDAADAYAILSRLSGRTHTVYTGVAVLTDGSEQVFSDAALVTFAMLSPEEIRAYIATGEPMDKAGAYGIQGFGALFVERVEGCYFTVIGLPLRKLYLALRRVGIEPAWMAKPQG